ncbi:hypothetical protein [Halosimplex sp. TS25]|uniref:hypothetical protein n=1 Tax=Halosimplex rarum TaxID=3396619 RepID=UPI0039E7AB8B
MDIEDDSESKILAEHKRNGWDVSDSDGRETTLVRTTNGSIRNHVIIAALTIWWTFGGGNVAYLIYSRLNPETKVIVEGAAHSSGSQVGTDVERATDEADQEQTPAPSQGDADSGGSHGRSEPTEHEHDPVYGAEERRELAYSMGKATSSVPLSGYFVRPVIWWYRLTLTLVPVLFGALGKRELGERLRNDNQIITEHVMAGHRNEPQPTK